MTDELKKFLATGIIEALHPTQDCLCEYHVDNADRDVKNKGVGRIRELYLVVPQVLLHPTAVYRGLPSRGADWLCYAGLPDRAFDYRTGLRIPPWQGEVFLVYINASLFVYNWRWETADLISAGLPAESDPTRYSTKVR